MLLGRPVQDRVGQWFSLNFHARGVCQNSYSMQGKREEWLRDVEARQRNIVSPDTAQNEARFWRNLLSGKEPLTIVQRVGLGILAFAVLVLSSG
jgi:hypothetical protein